MDIALEAVIERLSTLIKIDKPTTFVVGAGVSIPSGLPQWPPFAKAIAETLSQGHTRSAELIQASTGMRPEVLFQALFRAIGEKSLDAIRAMDPHRIRQRGVRCEPNALHIFLAKMIEMGHIVVTTNFDDLIEKAVGPTCLIASTQSQMGEIIPSVRDKRFSGIVKLHGTFRNHDGTESANSIGAILQEVQRAIPKQTKEILDLLVDEYPVVVFGHSGLDDFDLYQRLTSAALHTSMPTMWIMHVDEDEGNWRIYQGSQISDELESLKGMQRTSEYYKRANPFTIVQLREGLLIEARTTDFLRQVFPDIIDWSVADSTGEAGQAVRELVNDWAKDLLEIERQAAIASVFESSGPQFLGLAKEQIELQYSSPGTAMDKATRDLSVGRIIYKIGDSKAFDEAQSLLRSSAKFFSKQRSSLQAAEASLQLALLLNRRAITEESTHEMMGNARNALRLLAELFQTNLGYLFELGTALRVYALAIHRSLPDLDAITGRGQKEKCQTLLQKARKYANASLLAVEMGGNYLGERGQGQCLNVMGLVDLKLGSRDSLAAAKDEFEKVIDLSRRSGKGFEREEFQGHRNLGLVFRGLARIGAPDNRTDLLSKAIAEFKEAEKKANTPDIFNIRFNIILLEVEAAFLETNWDSVFNRLVELESMIPKDRKGEPHWHWAAWVNATAAKLASLTKKPDEALRRVVLVTKTYERIASGEIQRQAYGVQNGRTNLNTCLEVLNLVSLEVSLKQRVQQQSSRLSTLEQRIPEIRIDDNDDDPTTLVMQISRSK